MSTFLLSMISGFIPLPVVNTLNREKVKKYSDINRKRKEKRKKKKDDVPPVEFVYLCVYTHAR